MSIGRIAVFLVVVLSITAGIHYFLWIRLARDPAWPAPVVRGMGWALFVLAASIPLGLIASRSLSREAATPLSWFSYTWMGVMFVLFLTLLPMDLVRIAARLGGVDHERRVALARILAGAAGIIGILESGVGLATVLRRVKVETVRVPLAKLPKALSGYKIVQLTDVHVGPTIGRAFIEQIVRTTNALEPDMIAITGDLVDGSVADLGAFVEPLKELRAKDGVFFVTGNHEYYSGVTDWIAHLEKLGIRVLRNERLELREGLDLAGVDDTSAHNFGHGHGQDVARAMKVGWMGYGDREVVITDTVGFIRDLPKDLFAAFRATFEEAADADLLLHVVDASDPAKDDHIATTMKVLEDLDLEAVPRVVVYNKTDLVEEIQRMSIARANPEAVLVSATDRESLRPLVDRIARELASRWELAAKTPHSEASLPESEDESPGETQPDENELTTLDAMLAAAGRRSRGVHAK